MFMSELLSLTKPRVVLMVLITTFGGYYLAGGEIGELRFWLTLAGVALSAGGTMALNQFMESDIDRQMKRTMHRPLPSGRMHPMTALVFGCVITIVGLLILWRGVNYQSMIITTLIVIGYLLVYTPLKRKSPYSSIWGSIPGALPPVIGWVAVRGEIQAVAILLFAILFFWQLPHLLAISWIYRRDYSRAGIKVFPVVDPSGHSTAKIVIAGCLLLALTFCFSYRIIHPNHWHLLIALLLTGVYFTYGWQFARQKTNKSARRLLLTSYLYLPAILLTELLFLV